MDRWPRVPHAWSKNHVTSRRHFNKAGLMMVPLMAVPCALLVPVSAMEVQPRASEAVTVPVTIDADHLQVDVTINGQGPFHFLLDSGAVNVLTPALAKQLELPEGKRISATGTGGTQQATRTKVASVAIGGVTLTGCQAAGQDQDDGTTDDSGEQDSGEEGDNDDGEDD